MKQHYITESFNELYEFQKFLMLRNQNLVPSPLNYQNSEY